MDALCDNYGLKSLIRQTACYKIPSNLTCIDLILTNAKFQNVHKNFKALVCWKQDCQIFI